MVASWKIVIAALLLFAAGVVTGALTAGRLTPDTATRRSHRPAPKAGSLLVAGGATNRVGAKPPGFQRLEMLRRIGSQLDLPPAKHQRLDALIEESNGRLLDLWNPLAPRVQQELRDLRRRIEAELDPAQKERFESLLGRRNGTATPSPVREPW